MSADPTRQERVEALFHELAELPEPGRAQRLRELAGGDAALEREVAELLACLSAEGGRLDTPAVALVHDVSPGERLGQYRVIRLIGEGGMGQVYEVEQEFPRRRVALKVIRGAAASPGMLRRFEYEATALAQLRHPGIAQIYEAGFFDDDRPGPLGGRRPFFAMELVSGRRLDEHAAGLDTRAVLELMARIADAVHHAHQRGVIHRDLKPGNILVESDGGPKILDFGVARLTGEAEADRTMVTEAGQIVGTVAYMSPEQIRGRTDDVDTRSDVYALGVILYQLLAGRLPHDTEGSSIFDAAKLILEREPARLGALKRELRGDVETIVAAAMHKDRDRRYPSAAELAADLRRFLASEPISARPSSAAYQLRKFAGRNRALVGAAAVATAALVLGMAGLAVGMVRARDAEREARRTAEREAEARAAAERRFTQVRTLARTLIYDVYDEIEPLAGATRAKEKIIETGLAYTDGLARESTDDPTLQLELAGVYGRIAELLGDPAQPNLGQTAKALEQAQHGLALVQEVANRDPANTRAQTLLALALQRVAALLRVSGRMEESLAAYTRFAELAQAQAAARPDDADAQDAAARADATIGRMKEDLGRPDEAVDHYRRFQAHSRRLAGESLDDAVAATNILVMGQKLGEVLMTAGRLDESERELREAIALLDRVHARHPNDARAVSLRSSLPRALAYTLAKLGRGEEAAAAARRAVESDRAQINLDPADRKARRSLSASLFAVGNALDVTEDYPGALAAFTEYRAAADELAALDPALTSARQDVALSRLSMARVLNKMQRFDEARSVGEEGLAVRERLHAAEPLSAMWMVGLLDDLLALGNADLGLAQLAERGAAERRASVASARARADRAEPLIQSMLESRTAAPQAERKLAAFKELREHLDRIDRELDEQERGTKQPPGTPGG